MASNLDRFKKDLDDLISQGHLLELAMQYDCDPDGFKDDLTKQFGEETDKVLKILPSFDKTYQRWYSEALALLRQLLPDRVADFVRHYEKPKGRKDITFESYRIDDYLQGLAVTRGHLKEVVVNKEAAIPHFRQQLAIVETAKARFESSLFEIRQLVQAELLDSEIETAEALAKHKFTRAAGAIAGVVLERHLSQVCSDRHLEIGKKKPTLADFNETLKDGGVIDVPQWRFIQHLADVRNLCCHSSSPEPTEDQVADLLAGAKKITKSVY